MPYRSAVLLLPILSALAVGDDHPAPEPEAAVFRDRVVPLLEQYCLRCHGETKPKGEVNLARFKDMDRIGRDRKTWTRVLDNLSDGLMPPEDEPQPSEEERTFLAQWIEERLNTAGCDGDPYPGHVTIRRLNRAEYDNTIRDLLGIDFHASADFPSDDVGYGFDNIGDVLTLSPILLEKYFSAAERAAEQVIATDRTDRGSLRHWEGKELKDAGGQRHGAGRILPSSGEVEVKYDFPTEGEYALRTRAYGQQAGEDPARIAIRLDGKDLGTLDVPAVESAPGLYELKATVPAGEHRVAIAFVNDFYDKEAGADRNLVVMAVEVQGPYGAELLPLTAQHARLIPQEPKENSRDAWRDVTREPLRAFVSRAFRRPATDEDVEPLLGLLEELRQDGRTHSEAMRLIVQAVLVSPSFLFRAELDSGSAGSGTVVPLDDYAMASRLSYFLWSSMPDDELFDLASKGTLHEPETLAAQARRMLTDEKSAALVEGFAMQWLQLRNLESVSPSRSDFPKFSENLRRDMRTETATYFATVMREDRSILEFLDSDYVIVNARMADLYGLPGVEGEEFRRVSLEGDQRGGLLTQASVLTVTSNPRRTSPVKRGKWVLEQILGTPPPPPPPDVPLLNESREAAKSATLRERMEQHRKDPGCAICHSRLDPLGFVFENYDAIGGWRDRDGDLPIDPSGELPTGEKFTSAKQFKGYLLEKKDQFTRCLTEKLLTYALGRGLEPEDACEVDRIAAAVAADGYRFTRLVTEIVTSVPFRMREAQGAKP